MSNKYLEEFLACSVELESEARERYLELAEKMAQHNNDPVSEFFTRMAEESRLHLEEVSELAAGMSLPEKKPGDYDWPEQQAPETTPHDAVHYDMSLRQAMLLALDNERAAEKYYGSFAEVSPDEETRQLAAKFSAEEASHAAQLVIKISRLPKDTAGAA